MFSPQILCIIKCQTKPCVCVYTIIPTAVTTHNYMTVNMVSPASEDVIPEPIRSRKTIAYVICDSTSVNNVKSIFNSMGGLKIYSPDKS